MQLLEAPAWPKGLPYNLTPRANVRVPRALNAREWLDVRGQQEARRTRRRLDAIQNGGVTGTWTEALFLNRADYTAVASTAAEASLLGGVNNQPFIPALYFANTSNFGRGIKIVAKGVLSTTSTPTIIFQARLGSTLGSSYLSGTSVGVSAAITTQSGVTNKQWELSLDLVCNTPGIGTNNTTLSGAGWVTSPGGFAAPYIYPLQPTTPDTGTWTSTIDAALTYYLNLSVTWSASSASNTITLKHLQVLGLN